MIQRVQSIWLVLAVLSLICMFFLPLLTKTVDGGQYAVYTSGIHTEIKVESVEQYSVIFAISTITLNIITALLCFAAIFFYKNRRLQKGIIMVAMIVIIALGIICGFNGQQLPGGLNGISITIGTFLPVIALLFCLLALRGIRKDEQLLRSADRLR